MELVALFGGPVIGGIVWAFMVKAMIPNLGSLPVAYLIGAIVSLGVPFGVVMLLASTASTAFGAASLLQLSAYVCAFLGLMAFLVTFVLITGKDSYDE